MTPLDEAIQMYLQGMSPSRIVRQLRQKYGRANGRDPIGEHVLRDEVKRLGINRNRKEALEMANNRSKVERSRGEL